MENLNSWSALFYNSLQNTGTKIIATLPSVLGAMFILIIGWLFAKIVSGAIKKLLHVLRFNRMAEKIEAQKFLNKANIQTTPVDLVVKFFYYILLLLVLVTAADSLGWDALSHEISNLIGLLPNLLLASVFFIVGVYIATFVRDVIRGTTSSLGISAGRILGNMIFYLLLIIVSLTALEQAGLDTSIITSNLLLIIGAVLLTAAISYGFASREILSNILASFFSRRTFKVGQLIEIEGDRGRILSMTNVSLVIKNDAGEKIVIPTQQLIQHRVKIIEG